MRICIDELASDWSIRKSNFGTRESKSAQGNVERNATRYDSYGKRANRTRCFVPYSHKPRAMTRDPLVGGTWYKSTLVARCMGIGIHKRGHFVPTSPLKPSRSRHKVPTTLYATGTGPNVWSEDGSVVFECIPPRQRDRQTGYNPVDWYMHPAESTNAIERSYHQDKESPHPLRGKTRQTTTATTPRCGMHAIQRKNALAAQTCLQQL